MDIKHVAKLANLVLTSQQEKLFASQFAETLVKIDIINQLDTTQVASTYTVGSLKNVTRPDTIDTTRMLSRDQALSGAVNSHQGYFMVPVIIDEF